MSLVVVEAPLTEAAVGQGVLQEVFSVELVPRVFNLRRNQWKLTHVYIQKMSK